MGERAGLVLAAVLAVLTLVVVGLVLYLAWTADRPPEAEPPRVLELAPIEVTP